jgi:hypothetical protein
MAMDDRRGTKRNAQVPGERERVGPNAISDVSVLTSVVSSPFPQPYARMGAELANNKGSTMSKAPWSELSPGSGS